MKGCFLAPLALVSAACQAAPPKPLVNPPASLHSLKATTIDGKEISLDKYKGKVLLIVNVASKCGLTPQYAALEKLYREYKDKGLVVLGFPANDFMGQEPGTNAEIKEFCQTKYDVTFPMFAKITTKGDDASDVYRWLIAKSDRPQDGIEWNFAKFLVSKDGTKVLRFKPQVTPDAEALRKAIDGLLAE